MSALPIKENLKKYTRTDICPVRNIISRFTGKWSLLVICVLAENEATRFCEISRAIPDISSKVLTETLKNLESDGLISRTVYAEIPPRVEYGLTEKGKSLLPHIEGLICWALDHFNP
ncbi:MAG: helix-turn-helix transcriptional regulator [Muribaculum sp.]|nr:helix-turn-helix transcriptional regulator [Muribaculum sp.]